MPIVMNCYRKYDTCCVNQTRTILTLNNYKVKMRLMLKRNIVILILSALLLSPAMLFAGDYSFGVAIDVDAKIVLKEDITEYVINHLYEDYGIKVVDDNPKLKLSIVAYEVVEDGGKKTGLYVVSGAITGLFDNSILESMFIDKYKKTGASLTSNLCELQNQFLYFGSHSYLRTICACIAADVETECLVKSRKLSQQAKEVSGEK